MVLLLNERVRGGRGGLVFHLMKGDPFGAQENSPEQPAVLEDSGSDKDVLSLRT